MPTGIHGFKRRLATLVEGKYKWLLDGTSKVEKANP